MPARTFGKVWAGGEFEKIAPGYVVVMMGYITERASCTVLLAGKYIDSDESMMIANSDQYVDTDIDVYLDRMGITMDCS